MSGVSIDVLDAKVRERFPEYDNYDQLQDDSPEDAEEIFDLCLWEQKKAIGG